MKSSRENQTTKTIAALSALFLTGCTLYSNTDRENFNAQAVRQTPTSFTACAIQFSSPLEKLALLCPPDKTEDNSPTTIVRVSR